MNLGVGKGGARPHPAPAMAGAPLSCVSGEGFVYILYSLFDEYTYRNKSFSNKVGEGYRKLAQRWDEVYKTPGINRHRTCLQYA